MVGDLPKQVAARRAVLGLSQDALGARAGVTRSHVSRIESGRTDPRLTTLAALAGSLDAALVLVPLDRLSEVRRMIGAPASASDPTAGSAFDDVFIPDPSDAEG